MARKKPVVNSTTKNGPIDEGKNPDTDGSVSSKVPSLESTEATKIYVGPADDPLRQLMTDTMKPFNIDPISDAYLKIPEGVTSANSAFDHISQIAAGANDALDFGIVSRQTAELVAQATKSVNFDLGQNAYIDMAKGIAPPSTIEQMTGVTAAVRQALDFGAEDRKFAELIAQAAKPANLDATNAYLEMIKGVTPPSSAIEQMTGVAAATREALGFGFESGKFVELISQAGKPVSLEALSGWSSIFAEAQKPFNFPGLGDLSTQLAAHTNYLDPSRFRTPALPEEVAKYFADSITPSSVLEMPLGEIYVTDGERKLQKEVSTLRSALSRKTQALEKKTADAEAQAATVRKRDEMLAEYEHKEALLYILSRIHQDAGTVLLASDALQGHFRDERPLEAYVMSVDIRRSTDLMLKARTAKAYAGFITGLCNILKEIVIAHHGVFDKFTGDGILAFFPKFYTGEDAGFRAVLAAADCHTAFAKHYEHHRNTFVAVAKRVGLGIGIDRGDVHLVQVADGLTVVGTPVVYACRMGATPANTTLLNQPAYEEISRRYAEHCVLVETEFDVKHEGPVVAYGVVVANGKAFEFPDPAWKAFAQ